MMGAAALRRADSSLVAIVMTCVVAWFVLALGETGVVLQSLCSAGALWLLAPSPTFALALVLSSPAQIAASWALMLAAMMLPLTIDHLRHVHLRSFANRRTRSKLLFLCAYLSVWAAAGVVLQVVAVAARLGLPTLCVALVFGSAVLWQVSPAKQWCLNRCHRQPALAAFGGRADWDLLRYGARVGAACVGACSALMVLPLVVEQYHLAVMIAVGIFIYAERLEKPAPLCWRWRGAGKALRIALAQTRMRLGSEPTRRAVFRAPAQERLLQ